MRVDHCCKFAWLVMSHVIVHRFVSLLVSTVGFVMPIRANSVKVRERRSKATDDEAAALVGGVMVKDSLSSCCTCALSRLDVMVDVRTA